MINTTEILKELGIQPINPGACSGHGQWASGTNSGLLDSVNPATGEVLAQIYSCSATDVAVLVEESQQAFLNGEKCRPPNAARWFA
jgi:aldehyde dehydrogenase (NAD+)